MSEVAHAGGIYGTNNTSYYLYTGSWYWTITPYNFNGSNAYGFRVNGGGNLNYNVVGYSDGGVRPVINIRKDVDLTGDGSSTSPYQIIDKSEENKAKNTILANKTIGVRSDFSTTLTSDTTGVVYSAEDDDGTSYYFAGAPTDNYIKFAGFYWRIIRINGDGTIRLIYQGTTPTATGTDAQIGTSAFNSTRNDNMYVGYMYTSGSVHGLGTSSTIRGVLDDWYEDNLANYTEYIDSDAGFCGDRTSYTNTSGTTSGGGTGTTTTYYGPYVRLKANKSPSLKCSDSNDLYTLTSSSKGNKALSKPIGLITADEVAYAGSAYNVENSSYYLYTSSNYWTMSPYFFDGSYAYEFLVYSDGLLDFLSVSNSVGVRPVINLKADTVFEVGGLGTIVSPYIVK